MVKLGQKHFLELKTSATKQAVKKTTNLSQTCMRLAYVVSLDLMSVDSVGFIVGVGVKNLPSGRWKDVLVTIVPMPVHHLACAAYRSGLTGQHEKNSGELCVANLMYGRL